MSKSLLRVYLLDGSHKTVSYDENTTVGELVESLCFVVKVALFEVREDLYDQEQYRLLFSHELIEDIVARWTVNTQQYAKFVLPLYEFASATSSTAMPLLTINKQFNTMPKDILTSSSTSGVLPSINSLQPAKHRSFTDLSYLYSSNTISTASGSDIRGSPLTISSSASASFSALIPGVVASSSSSNSNNSNNVGIAGSTGNNSSNTINNNHNNNNNSNSGNNSNGGPGRITTTSSSASAILGNMGKSFMKAAGRASITSSFISSSSNSSSSSSHAEDNINGGNGSGSLMGETSPRAGGIGSSSEVDSMLMDCEDPALRQFVKRLHDDVST